MGQQTFNNRGHDGLFHPSAIPRFTLPVSADRVVFPTLYPGGSRRTGSGKPFPLVDLAVDFIAGDLSDGDRRSAWRSRRRSSFCSNHQRFLSLPPGFCEGNRIAGGAFRSLGSRPGLLKSNLASLRLAMPVALIASTMAIVGAMVGLALPTHIIQLSLGGTILAIVVIMLSASKSELPHVEQADSLSTALRITGIYHEPSMNRDIPWKIHRTWPGLFSFIIIGFMAGMFGLGAGWANVPVLNLLMGAPLKISVATSKFLLSITDTSAAWIYLNKGAVIPMMVLPSLIGIMLGSFVGVRILKVAKPTFIRWMVIGILFFAGLKAISKGLESYGVTFF